MNAGRARLRAIRVIAARTAWNLPRGAAGYLVLFLALQLAALLVANFLRGVGDELVSVTTGVMTSPALTAMLIVATYLGAHAAGAISRERDQGTLEVLFYGPVDALAYVAGTFAGYLPSILGATAILLIYFVLSAALTAIRLSGDLYGVISLSLLLSMQVVAFGLLVSVLGRTARVAVALFFALAIALFAIQTGYQALASFPAEVLSTPLIFGRAALGLAERAVAWVSPLAYFTRILDAANVGGSPLAAAAAAAVAYLALLLGLAAGILLRQGPRT